jgi:hypothetical protein
MVTCVVAASGQELVDAARVAPGQTADADRWQNPFLSAQASM